MISSTFQAFQFTMCCYSKLYTESVSTTIVGFFLLIDGVYLQVAYLL